MASSRGTRDDPVCIDIDDDDVQWLERPPVRGLNTSHTGYIEILDDGAYTELTLEAIPQQFSTQRSAARSNLADTVSRLPPPTIPQHVPQEAVRPGDAGLLAPVIAPSGDEENPSPDSAVHRTNKIANRGESSAPAGARISQDGNPGGLSANSTKPSTTAPAPHSPGLQLSVARADSPLPRSGSNQTASTLAGKPENQSLTPVHPATLETSGIQQKEGEHPQAQNQDQQLDKCQASPVDVEMGNSSSQIGKVADDAHDQHEAASQNKTSKSVTEQRLNATSEQPDLAAAGESRSKNGEDQSNVSASVKETNRLALHDATRLIDHDQADDCVQHPRGDSSRETDPPRAHDKLFKKPEIPRQSNHSIPSNEMPKPVEGHSKPRQQSEPESTLDVVHSDATVVRSAIAAILKRLLRKRYEDHAYLTSRTLWRSRTCFERDALAQGDKGKSLTVPTVSDRYIQYQSPFANLTPIDKPSKEVVSLERRRDVVQDMTCKGHSKNPVTRWSLSSDVQTFEKNPIPQSKEYVTLSTNILADNESKLTTMPYLEGEPETTKLIEDLPKLYEIRHDKNILRDLRNEQCRFYSKTIEEFMTEIGISWDSIFFWLLAPETTIRELNKSLEGHKSYQKGLLARSKYEVETFRRDEKMRKEILFDRTAEKWPAFMDQLEQPTVSQLRLSSLACATILDGCNFNPWYMAETSQRMQSYVQQKLDSARPDQSYSFKTAMCRLCHEHDCMFHGQRRGFPDSNVKSSSSTNDKTRLAGSNDGSDEDSGDEIPAHIDVDDGDVEHAINYKVHLNANSAPPGGALPNSKPKVPPDGPFDSKFWLHKTLTTNWRSREPFVPCNHQGSCVDAACRCYLAGVTCEKTCRCDKLCNRRFPGCSCNANKVNRQRICKSEWFCLCLKFKRECDADLCGSCGARDILDPMNRHDEDVVRGRCWNVGMQRGIPKKTLLGQSEVHGFGLYAGQDILQHQFIGEYIGEIISKGEDDRRSHIYDLKNTMYLFEVNKVQTIDSTFMGNKTRFINNANHALTNCSAKTLFCNGVFRVGLYASEKIKAGTELFFNYGYPAQKTKNFKQPKAKVVAVKKLAKSAARKTATKKPHTLSNGELSSDSRASSTSRTRAGRLTRPTKRLEPTSFRPRSRLGRTLSREFADEIPDDGSLYGVSRTMNQLHVFDDSGEEDDYEMDDVVFNAGGSEAEKSILDHMAQDSDEDFVPDTRQSTLDHVAQGSDEDIVPDTRQSKSGAGKASIRNNSDEGDESLLEQDPDPNGRTLLPRAVKTTSVVAVKRPRRRLFSGLARKRKRAPSGSEDEN